MESVVVFPAEAMLLGRVAPCPLQSQQRHLRAAGK